MNPSLTVQIIHTSWTKKSRGAPLATPRNSVPLAFPLLNLQDGFLQIKRFLFAEGQLFQNPQPKREQLELAEGFHYDYGSFNLDWDGQTATTEFKKSWWNIGAPEPKVFSPRLAHFILSCGEWARIRWQGRFSDSWDGQSNWWYEHTCINVGCFDSKTPLDVFLCSEPARQFIHLPNLW